MLFYAKIGTWRKNLHVCHTLFILYLEGNYTLFENLAVATLINVYMNTCICNNIAG